MNSAQERAVQIIRRHLDNQERQLDGGARFRVVEWRVEERPEGRGVHVVARMEWDLPAGNLLSVLDLDAWYFAIGPRGAVRVYGYPRRYDQFKGRRAFGWFFVRQSQRY